jgi:hypothetical protein
MFCPAPLTFIGRQTRVSPAVGPTAEYETPQVGTNLLAPPPPARDRDSDGDRAYRLLGSLSAASQPTSEMLAETRRTSKRMGRPRRRNSASGCVSQGLSQHRPLVVTLRRQHRAASAARQYAEQRAIAPEAAEDPMRADANPVRHRGSCPRGNPHCNETKGFPRRDRVAPGAAASRGRSRWPH